MKERPILFNGHMIRALLDGSKTQTRRMIKPQPSSGVRISPFVGSGIEDGHGRELRCPYGKPGDGLWVRETWQHANHPFGPYLPGTPVFYRADYLYDPHGPDGEKSAEGKYRFWRPSIHMPRMASRITLEITGVRVERLQDISETDAQAEGCALECTTPTGDDNGSAIYGPGGFMALWESINGLESWNANPWVWVVEYQRM